MSLDSFAICDGCIRAAGDAERLSARLTFHNQWSLTTWKRALRWSLFYIRLMTLTNEHAIHGGLHAPTDVYLALSLEDEAGDVGQSGSQATRPKTRPKVYTCHSTQPARPYLRPCTAWPRSLCGVRLSLSTGHLSVAHASPPDSGVVGVCPGPRRWSKKCNSKGHQTLHRRQARRWALDLI